MNFPYYILTAGASGSYNSLVPFVPKVPMLFIYGTNKPFMFHSPQWTENLAAKEGCKVVAMKPITGRCCASQSVLTILSCAGWTNPLKMMKPLRRTLHETHHNPHRLHDRGQQCRGLPRLRPSNPASLVQGCAPLLIQPSR